ncbi:UDP-2,3-diacylglucosamine diphosphatase [Photobacterium indicum]|jgi:UDP-2,3-diacylglucosamine hydrolase|uniref:UDP-2,3-diacylglucosamine hydrolase n=1 Tax=Photobacterium indicum TaxID=81447 RepID=A0A2T3LB32_9GAMM|nr:UDP-2,3-diacylglucosamine diphosphatase [Photobacterium indicum]PSV48545.1 UDP-2,3-diacylglucosamine diphosphatase [Photobacterium indicum]
MTTLFIADLHLSAERTDITDCFLHFMQHEARNIDALYVLGDLFEMWIGDDDNSPFLQQIKHAFKQLTDSGVPCYFIYGNRDFLIGSRFCQETGMTLLPEHTVIDLYGTPTLILHGDTLCIEDEDYLRYRKRVHNRFIQWLFFCLPLTYRQKVGDKIRSGSSKNNKEKTTSIMDVTPDEVVRLMAEQNVVDMIHGHTHRPDVHHIEVNGKSATRTVLGDWYHHGSVLVCTPDGCKLETRDFNEKVQ